MSAQLTVVCSYDALHLSQLYLRSVVSRLLLFEVQILTTS